jgi:hypothetical protein
MRVYRGKLNWYNYAVNESCTFVFPGSFDVGQPVYALWQWTKDAAGTAKGNVFLEGHVNADSVVDGKRKILFHYENYYHFDAVIGSDEKSISLTMWKDANGKIEKANPTTLDLALHNKDTSKFLIYIGKYTEAPYADNEMITVIGSPSIYYGNPIGVFWQWTKDAQGAEKVMQTYTGTVTSFHQANDGIKLEFIKPENYYKFDMRVDNQFQKMKLRIANDPGLLPNKPNIDLTLKKSSQ